VVVPSLEPVGGNVTKEKLAKPDVFMSEIDFTKMLETPIAGVGSV
jgi:hypothetical protein